MQHLVCEVIGKPNVVVNRDLTKYRIGTESFSANEIIVSSKKLPHLFIAWKSWPTYSASTYYGQSERIIPAFRISDL